MARNEAGPLPPFDARWVHRGGSLDDMLASAPEVVPLDPPGPDEVVARVEAVSICSSDVKAVRMGADHPLFAGAGAVGHTVLGHETCLRVAAVGATAAARFHVGQRLALQPAMRLDGRRRIIGFDLPGGFARHLRLGREALDGYVFDAPENLSAAEIAMLEPYGCVERAYRPNARTAFAAGGSALLVVGPDAARYRLDSRPGWASLAAVAGPDAVLPAFADPLSERLDDIAGAAGRRFDDILALGEIDAATLAALPPLLADGGLLLQARRTPLGPVPIDPARIHYDALSFVGTTGEDVAGALAPARTRFDVRAGGVALVHGAGGAMGRIHVHRLLQHPRGPATVVATSRQGRRLDDLEADFGAIAAAGGRRLVTVEAGGLGEAVARLAPEGVDDAVVVAPDAAAVAEVAAMLRPDGLLAVFAGFAYGRTVPFDLAAVATGGRRVTGSTGCAVDDMKDVLARVVAGELDLSANLKAVAGLNALARALDAVARGGVSGKVVVYPQAPDLPFAPVGDRWTAADERGLLGEADEDAGAANGRD